MDSKSGRGRGGRGRGGRGRGRGVKRPRFEGNSGDGDDNNAGWQSQRNGRSRRRQHSPHHPRGEQASHSNSNTTSAPPSQPLKCSVCQLVEQPKYKCPKCRESYCCIACCQQHKLSCPQHPPAESNPEHGQPRDEKSKPCHSKYLPPESMQHTIFNETNSSFRQGRDNHRRPYEEEDDDDDDDDLEDDWKITETMKAAVNGCDWLKRELQDSGLRQLITQTVAASRIVQQNGKTAQENSLETLKATSPMFATFCDKLLVVTGVLERQEKGGGDHDLEDWLNRGPEELGQLVLKPIARQRSRPVDVAKVEHVESDESSSAASSSEDSSDSSTDSGSGEDDST